MQILIVEDEEKNADFLRRDLIEERYAFCISPDGEEAISEIYCLSRNSLFIIIINNN